MTGTLFVETTLSGIAFSTSGTSGGTLTSAPTLSGTFTEEFVNDTLVAVTDHLFITLGSAVTTFSGSATVEVSTGGYQFANIPAGTGGGSNPAGQLFIGSASENPSSTTINASIAFGSSHYFSNSQGTITSVALCFAEGTHILTPDGEVAVESLKAGDLVTTSAGAALPVRWLGRSEIAGRFADPLTACPICIRAGALGENLPLRDLRVSPAHALYLDGILVQAAALVNGVSIIRDTMAEHFTYYHIELDTHELIISEGTVTESFVDNVDRLNFSNTHQRDGRAYTPITEMDLPRAKSHRQVPEALRSRLTALSNVFPGGESSAA